jgi:hypothetical protein
MYIFRYISRKNEWRKDFNVTFLSLKQEDQPPCGGAKKRPYLQESMKVTRKVNKSDVTMNDLMKACSTALSQPTTQKIDVSEHEATGIAIVKKLQRMDPVQAIYADTLIHSVLR